MLKSKLIINFVYRIGFGPIEAAIDRLKVIPLKYALKLSDLIAYGATKQTKSHTNYLKKPHQITPNNINPDF